MTSFVKNPDIEGSVLVQTANVSAEISDKPYEPETREAELDLLDVAAACGNIVVKDEAPSDFSKPEPVVVPFVGDNDHPDDKPVKVGTIETPKAEVKS